MHNHDDPWAWLHDFNDKMLKVALKINALPQDRWPTMFINSDDELVRRKTKEDPTGRGAKKFKAALQGSKKKDQKKEELNVKPQ